MQETILNYLKITAEAAGFTEPKSIAEIVGAIIGAFLSFLGIIFFTPLDSFLKNYLKKYFKDIYQDSSRYIIRYI